MLQTKKISDAAVAVSFDPTEILIRKSGKQYFGKEKALARITDGKLVIDESVAEEFGIEIERKSDLKEIAKRAFDLYDWMVGSKTGGIEAPRDIIAVEDAEDGSVKIRWKHPATCGLSDVRYHYIDTGAHEDTFLVVDDVLEVNGKSGDIFELEGWDFPELKSAVAKFYEKYGLRAA